MNTPFFEKLYEEKTRESRRLFERGSRVLPGGVAGNGKFLQPYPIYVRKAFEARIVDADDNEYIDLLMGAGVYILGHSNPSVREAVQRQIEKGVHYYLPAEAEVMLAEKVCELMPSVDMVRFVNTGSEATQMALRAARAYRTRDKIAKFEGNFHGQHESVLVSTLKTSGDPAHPEPHIDSAGIPKHVTQDLLVLPYNDADQAVRLIERSADELGAVIMEPVSAFGLGCVAAEPEFLRAVRDVTAKHGIPLIFDEVVTNFRIALGGAAEYFGVEPDLVCLGKILGGGFPIGGFGGRREIMEKVVTPTGGLWDLSEKIFQSGCFSGNPLSMTAGLAVLAELENRPIYAHVNELCEQLSQGITKIGKDFGQEILVTRVASMFQIHFGVTTLRNKRDTAAEDKEAAKLFHLGLRANGIMASAHPLFLSAEHTREDVSQILEAAEVVLSRMSEEVPI
jgi:glutamate-1-semialdehyde 2,1-aminomutase